MQTYMQHLLLVTVASVKEKLGKLVKLSGVLALVCNCAAPDFTSAQRCAAICLWKKKTCVPRP